MIAALLFVAAELAAGLLPELFKAAFGDKPRQLILGTAAALAVAVIAIYIRFRRSRTDIVEEPPDIAPEKLERARNALLHRVHQMWTRDLDHRWDDTVRIELGLEDSPMEVDDPWASTRLTTQSGSPFPQGTRMRTVYERHGLQLLVLGAPGAGKTVHMLELTQELVDHAMTEATAPVPVFLLLTNWRGEPMEPWVEEELGRRYRVPADAAKALLSRGMIDLVLDGLDEVDPSRHKECVAEINGFLSADGHPQCGIAVSCRTTEYEALPARLSLSGAVTVQPLPVPVVHAFLNDAGPRLHGLRAAAAADPELTRLLTTPLMLGIAAVAYSGVDESSVYSFGTSEERRGLVYEAFLEKMITRDRTLRGQSVPARYSVEEVTERLTRMAYLMSMFHATVIYPTDLARLVTEAPTGVLREALRGTFLGRMAPLVPSHDRVASMADWPWLKGYRRVVGLVAVRRLDFLRPDFIDFCCERALLRRSGDGIAFIHKTFQDHLVGRYDHLP
ncbi:NACHT domain-containing protein [Streptomyces sp. NPDC004244]